jgi:hypothetical protein
MKLRNWFITLTVAGAILSILPWIGDNYFMKWGGEGLVIEQQMEMQQKQFENEYALREQAEKHRQTERDHELQIYDRQIEMLRLQRPATPQENF